jgi:hypothetical protein
MYKIFSATALELVNNLIKAYEVSIRELDWMSEATKLEALEAENHRHTHRELSWHSDGDSMWVLKGKFTAEQGALIEKALEGAMNEMFEEQRNEPADVSAETSNQSDSQIKEMAWRSRPQPCHRCGEVSGWTRTWHNWR